MVDRLRITANGRRFDVPVPAGCFNASRPVIVNLTRDGVHVGAVTVLPLDLVKPKPKRLRIFTSASAGKPLCGCGAAPRSCSCGSKAR